MTSALIDLAPEVAEALQARRPVVALESTLIAHGLPWPHNLETARAAEQAVRDAGATPATIAVLDGRMHVVRANRSFYGVFQVRPADTEGRYLFELGNGQWDIPALRALLAAVLENEKPIEGYEVKHAFPVRIEVMKEPEGSTRLMVISCPEAVPPFM